MKCIYKSSLETPQILSTIDLDLAGNKRLLRVLDVC